MLHRFWFIKIDQYFYTFLLQETFVLNTSKNTYPHFFQNTSTYLFKISIHNCLKTYQTGILVIVAYLKLKIWNIHCEFRTIWINNMVMNCIGNELWRGILRCEILPYLNSQALQPICVIFGVYIRECLPCLKVFSSLLTSQFVVNKKISVSAGSLHPLCLDI